MFVVRAEAPGLSEARESGRAPLADFFRGDDARDQRRQSAAARALEEFLDGAFAVQA
jgi:hypothetical protein